MLLYVDLDCKDNLLPTAYVNSIKNCVMDMKSEAKAKSSKDIAVTVICMATDRTNPELLTLLRYHQGYQIVVNPIVEDEDHRIVSVSADLSYSILTNTSHNNITILSNNPALAVLTTLNKSVVNYATFTNAGTDHA